MRKALFTLVVSFGIVFFPNSLVYAQARNVGEVCKDLVSYYHIALGNSLKKDEPMEKLIEELRATRYLMLMIARKCENLPTG